MLIICPIADRDDGCFCSPPDVQDRTGKVMWRSLVAAVLVYGCGHPGLEGLRPSLFDRPLQGFHNEVNKAAYEGQRMLASIGDSSYVRGLKGYVEYLGAQLRGSSDQRD